MFEDQTIELLPERTTLCHGYGWGGGGGGGVFQSGNIAIAIAINAGNINFGGDQINTAVATAIAGSNVG